MRDKSFHIESKIASEELNGEKIKILSLFDFCMFILIIVPASVTFTAATWDLTDQLEIEYSSFIPIVGVIFYVFLNITPYLAYDVARHILKNKFMFSVFSQIYIYIFATSAVSQWNYVWECANTFDLFNQLTFVVSSTITFSVVLFICKRLVNLIGGHSPATEDSSLEDVFLFPTMFETEVLFSEHIGNRFLYFFSSRLYTQIFGIASVSSWYGVWNAFDSLTGGNIKITVVIVLISYVGLFCTKTVRNITSSPFALITDRRQGYFDVPTLFQWSNIWKKNKFLYILDSIFSVFIVGTLVILVWRGAWCLLDQTIFPGEQTYLLSGWISLGIGYSIVFATFALQKFMKILIRMYHGWRRLIIIDTYVVVSFCGTINIWRGIWILLEEYANLEDSLLNCVILHFLSFFILVIFNSSNTLLVRGVYIDAEENGEDCVEFPCYYFRLRFQEKQKKKTLIELNAVTNNQIRNVEQKDNTRLNNEQDKKPEAEIISEINPQQVPLILNNSPSNGEVTSSKIEENSNS